MELWRVKSHCQWWRWGRESHRRGLWDELTGCKAGPCGPTAQLAPCSIKSPLRPFNLLPTYCSIATTFSCQIVLPCFLSLFLNTTKPSHSSCALALSAVKILTSATESGGCVLHQKAGKPNYCWPERSGAVKTQRLGSVPGHGYETARCAGHAAISTPVAASVSRAFCSALI